MRDLFSLSTPEEITKFSEDFEIWWIDVIFHPESQKVMSFFLVPKSLVLEIFF